MSDRDRDPRAAPRVAIIARQGKFLVAEPFFGDGPRLAVSRDKRYDVGDLVELSGACRRPILAPGPAVRAPRARAARAGRRCCAGSAGRTSLAT